MVEHNLSVVSKLSDRITVLTRGRVLAEGTTKRYRTTPTCAKPIWEWGMDDRVSQPLLAVAGLQAWYGESHILHG